MAPQPNDLFMNVWHSRLYGEAPKPGSRGWNPEAQNRYWARVWLHCVELAKHLAACEARIDAVEAELTALDAPSEPGPEPVDLAEVVADPPVLE